MTDLKGREWFRPKIILSLDGRWKKKTSTPYIQQKYIDDGLPSSWMQYNQTVRLRYIYSFSIFYVLGFFPSAVRAYYVLGLRLHTQGPSVYQTSRSRIVHREVCDVDLTFSTSLLETFCADRKRVKLLVPLFCMKRFDNDHDHFILKVKFSEPHYLSKIKLASETSSYPM